MKIIGITYLIGLLFSFTALGLYIRGAKEKSEYFFAIIFGLIWPITFLLIIFYFFYESIKNFFLERKRKAIELLIDEAITNLNEDLKNISLHDWDGCDEVELRSLKKSISELLLLLPSRQKIESIGSLFYQEEKEFEILIFTLENIRNGSRKLTRSSFLNLKRLFLIEDPQPQSDLILTPDFEEYKLPFVFRSDRSSSDDVESWTGIFTKDFNKSVKNLDKKMKGRVVDALEEILEDPVTPKGDTVKRMVHLKDHWRYRIGDYRLLYMPDIETKNILFVKIDSRGDVYH